MEIPAVGTEPETEVASLYTLAWRVVWVEKLRSYIPQWLSIQIARGQKPVEQFYRAASTWAVALKIPTHELVGPVPNVTRAVDSPQTVPLETLANPRYPPGNPDRFLQRLQPGLHELVIRSRLINPGQTFPANLDTVQKISLSMVSPKHDQLISHVLTLCVST